MRFTSQSETNVVNSGTVVGYQAYFDSVWMCLAWRWVGKSLDSGAHPTYKEFYLTVWRPNTSLSSVTEDHPPSINC